MNIEELIETLKKCDLSKVAHNKIMSTIFENDIRLPIITSLIKKGAIIQRGRISDKGKIYSSEFDISYRTDIGNILKYGRANRPFQSMFYGAMPSKKITYPTRTLFAELVEQFRKIPNEGFETTMTVGRWFVKKEFEIADICFSKNYLNVKEIKEDYDYWDKKIKGTVIGIEQNRKLLTFFSDLFSKKNIINNSDYKIGSVYTDFALDENLKGILYPSVRTDYNSRNIALTPSAVEEHLELKEAAVFKYKVDKGKPIAIQTHYSNELGHFNSRFEWKEY